jgi:hypothetical protein
MRNQLILDPLGVEANKSVYLYAHSRFVGVPVIQLLFLGGSAPVFGCSAPVLGVQLLFFGGSAPVFGWFNA